MNIEYEDFTAYVDWRQQRDQESGQNRASRHEKVHKALFWKGHFSRDAGGDAFGRSSRCFFRPHGRIGQEGGRPDCVTDVVEPALHPNPELPRAGWQAGSSQFQAVIPFRAWNTSNILRATVNYTNTGPAADGLSDVTIFNLLVFEKPWGRWGAGPVAQLLPDRGGNSDTFAIGPAVGFVVSSGRWTYGLFNQNLFGDDIAISSLQPVLAYQMGNGWALAAGDAQWTRDWDRGKFVNLPVGVQLSKVSRIGGQAVKWAAFRSNAEADVAPGLAGCLAAHDDAGSRPDRPAIHQCTEGNAPAHHYFQWYAFQQFSRLGDRR